MRKTWPLWWCIPVEAQRDLMQYQHHNYSFMVDIPPQQNEPQIDTKLESLDGINAIKKVGLRYGRLPKHLR